MCIFFGLQNLSEVNIAQIILRKQWLAIQTLVFADATSETQTSHFALPCLLEAISFNGIIYRVYESFRKLNFHKYLSFSFFNFSIFQA